MEDHELPKLPGYNFGDKLKFKHHVPQSFGIRNGYKVSKVPTCGIGGDPLKANSIAFCSASQSDSALYDPVLTYGRLKSPVVPPFRPHFVLYDKKVLKFLAFFKQSVPESRLEHYRVRHVDVYYFLEDDTMTVIEPSVQNCGFPQGKLVRRGRMVKNTKGQCYSWKDLNVGIDIELQGIVFHIVDCDPFTKEFLISNGIELNESECVPIDPATTERRINQFMLNQSHHKTPSIDDKLRRFLEFQGKVLQFDCMEAPNDECGHDVLTYKLFYYLEDDTVAIKELKENQQGRDHFPMLLKRTKLPKNWKRKPVTYPSIALELTDAEVDEYYQPKDFKIGETIFVFGRKFLLLNCDRFTRTYFENVLKEVQGNRLEIKKPERKVPKRDIPQYLGLGTPEDSIASCYSLVPKPPKKDIINYLVNAHRHLRYGCVLDSAHPEDKLRQFILIYALADGTIQIMEKTIENTGIQGGRFLSSTKIPRSGCNLDSPDYYTPKDFCIGSIITVFSHRFVIVSADLYVLRYMERYPEQFSQDAIKTVQEYHGCLSTQQVVQPDGNQEELNVTSRKECDAVTNKSTPDIELRKVYHSNECKAKSKVMDKKVVKFENDFSNLH